MKRQAPKIILYAAILLAVFAAQQRLTRLEPEGVRPARGVADLGGLDLSRQLAEIDEEEWEFYPERMLEPEDFTAGAAGVPVFEATPGAVHYGTYRLRIVLPAGRAYAMTGRSFPFSQRVFIDGVLVDRVGTPGATRPATAPRSKRYFYSFTPADDAVEIVFQTANFHHRDGARNAPIKIAEPDVVHRHRALEFIRSSTVEGCFLAVFFYFLGMFIFFSRRPHFLYLALACLATAARMLFIGEKHIMEIFPDLDWFVALRAEYMFLVAFVAAFLLYFHSLYPGMLGKRFVAAILCLSALYAAAIALCDTLFFTHMLKWYSLVWAAAAGTTLWRLAFRLRRGDTHTTLIFTGLALFAATAAFDEIAYRFLFHARTHNLLLAGMMACVFLNTIALTLDFSEIETALAEAEGRRRELDEKNRLLDRLGAMKTRFMANISHEMKTPLTVMSVHAQLAKALLAAGEKGNGEIAESLDTISRESARLARMVTGMLDLGGMNETRSEMERLDVGALARTCGEVCRAMIEKKGNALRTDVPDGLPAALGNADMLSQVMLNLLANANRYTENGTITVRALEDDGRLAVVVEDSGRGIPPDLLPHVFERRAGEKRGGGSGLGLAICRTIIEMHGGEIGAESVSGRGTAVRFTLPAIKDET